MPNGPTDVKPSQGRLEWKEVLLNLVSLLDCFAEEGEDKPKVVTNTIDQEFKNLVQREIGTIKGLLFSLSKI